ncbi:MAG TPA: protein kinase [Dehalococcoidia bacterium]|nr:protein kinase [Dehalococcoidia bacterium]
MTSLNKKQEEVAVFVNTERCTITNECWCKQWCPVGAIRWRRKYAWIDSSTCFSCGECCRMIDKDSPSCAAIQPINHLPYLSKWIDSGEPYAVLIGPGIEHYSLLKDMHLGRVCGVFKRLGAKAVFRSRLGVPESLEDIKNYVKDNISRSDLFIDSRCGAIRNYVRRNDRLKQYLVKAKSTFFASAEVAREECKKKGIKDIKIVFLGPDISYKETIMKEYVGLVNAVITWSEFEKLCENYNVSLDTIKYEELDDPPPKPAGEIPRVGTVEEALKELNIPVKRVSGNIRLVLNYLKKLEPIPGKKLFIEILACGDCSQGPGIYEIFKDDFRRKVTKPDIRNPKPNDTFTGEKATYVFHRFEGEGAAGEVYRIWVNEIFTPETLPSAGPFALKVYKEWLFHREEPGKQEEKIKNEVKVAKLESIRRNPNIVRIFWDDRIPVEGSEGKNHVLLMEFISGETLSHYILGRSLNQSEIIRIMEQLCGAVKGLHDEGACHRDIKPDNIMVTKEKDNKLMIKLMDFGVIKLMDFPGVPLQSLAHSRFGGTRDYAALEWLDGRVSPTDVEAWKLIDIYGIGCVLFDLLMGEKGPKKVYTTREKRRERLEELRRRSLSPLEELMSKLLADDPKERIPQSISEVIEILNNIRNR